MHEVGHGVLVGLVVAVDRCRESASNAHVAAVDDGVDDLALLITPNTAVEPHRPVGAAGHGQREAAYFAALVHVVANVAGDTHGGQEVRHLQNQVIANMKRQRPPQAFFQIAPPTANRQQQQQPSKREATYPGLVKKTEEVKERRREEGVCMVEKRKMRLYIRESASQSKCV
jgi:hypothetical protein